MNEQINKIVIIGGPGTGKTTLANNLGKELNIPVHHLDAINHLNNWQKRNAKERDYIILNIINGSKWITDGTYKTTLEQRINKSDLVIFLDFSVIARVRGIISRYIQLKGKERPEILGCTEHINLNFIKLALNWNHTKRKAVTEILMQKDDKKILIFKNRKMLNKWYNKKFNKKISITNILEKNHNQIQNNIRLCKLNSYKISNTIDKIKLYSHNENKEIFGIKKEEISDSER